MMKYQNNLTKLLNPYKSIENINIGYNIYTNKVGTYLDLIDYDNNNFRFRKKYSTIFNL